MCARPLLPFSACTTGGLEHAVYPGEQERSSPKEAEWYAHAVKCHDGTRRQWPFPGDIPGGSGVALAEMRENGAMRLHLLRRSRSLGARRVPLPVGVRLKGILKRCLMNQEGAAEACSHQFLARPAISTEGHAPPLAVPENQPI